jgi:hypothetical protein
MQAGRPRSAAAQRSPPQQPENRKGAPWVPSGAVASRPTSAVLYRAKSPGSDEEDELFRSRPANTSVRPRTALARMRPISAKSAFGGRSIIPPVGSASAARTAATEAYNRTAVADAAHEVYRLCDQLRLPQHILEDLTFALEDPRQRDRAVSVLRDHKALTLSALRQIEGRERTLRCLDEVRTDTALATPRTRARLESESHSIAAALKSMTADISKALDEWIANRQLVLSTAGKKRFAVVDEDRNDDLVFLWQGVDYRKKMIEDAASQPTGLIPLSLAQTRASVDHTAQNHSFTSHVASHFGESIESGKHSAVMSPLVALAPPAKRHQNSFLGIERDPRRIGAAVTIQRCFRLYRVRQRQWYLGLRRTSAIKIQRWHRRRHFGRLSRAQRSRLVSSTTSALGMSSGPSGLFNRSSDHALLGQSGVASLRQSSNKFAEVVEAEQLFELVRRQSAVRRIVRFVRECNRAASVREEEAKLAQTRRANAAFVITRFFRRAVGLLRWRRRQIAAIAIQRQYRSWSVRRSSRHDASSLCAVDRVMEPSEMLPGDVSLENVAINQRAANDDVFSTLSPSRGRVVVEASFEEPREQAAANSPVDPGEAEDTVVVSDSLTAAAQDETSAAPQIPSGPSSCRPPAIPFAVKYRRVRRDDRFVLPVFDNEERRSRFDAFQPYWAGDYEAALAIQKAYRRHLAKKRVQRIRSDRGQWEAQKKHRQRTHAAATTVQSWCRFATSLRLVSSRPSSSQNATCCIQRWWRALLARGVVGVAHGHHHEDNVFLTRSGARASEHLWESAMRRRIGARVITEWWIRLRLKRAHRQSRQGRAALYIQRWWRDFKCRRDYLYSRMVRKRDNAAAQDRSGLLLAQADRLQRLAVDTAEYLAWRTIHDTALERIEFVNEQIRSRPDRNSAATRIQCAWRSARARERRWIGLQGQNSRWARLAIRENLGECATRLQAWWRGRMQRHVLRLLQLSRATRMRIAAVRIQALARSWLTRRRLRRAALEASPAYRAASEHRARVAQTSRHHPRTSAGGEDVPILSFL